MDISTENLTYFQSKLSSLLGSELSHYHDVFMFLEHSLKIYVETDNKIPLEILLLRILLIDQINNDYFNLPESLQSYVSDCFIVINQYQSAEAFYPMVPFAGKSALTGNKLINLRLINGSKILARDLFLLFGPLATSVGQKNLQCISEFMDIELEKTDVSNFLHNLKGLRKIDYCLFPGLPCTYYVNKKNTTEFFEFSNSIDLFHFVKEITHKAENHYRIGNGLPKIGEGWISETVLFYEISKTFPQYKVIQHASPSWLGRQHLDIYLPELQLGIEYQGIQHYKPIDFFGGSGNYEATVKRDKRKRNLCKKHGVSLIFVTQDQDLKYVMDKVREQETVIHQKTQQLP